MLVGIKSQVRNLLLIGCCMLFCNGIQVAHAQNFTTASYYLLSSNTNLGNGWADIDSALYYKNATYFYNSYTDLSSAYNNAYIAYNYAVAGYNSYPTTLGYYSYYWSYYNYLYAYSASLYAYNSYLYGVASVYVPSLIYYISLADQSNGYAAYFCGLSSIGGTQ